MLNLIDSRLTLSIFVALLMIELVKGMINDYFIEKQLKRSEDLARKLMNEQDETAVQMKEMFGEVKDLIKKYEKQKGKSSDEKL